MQAKPEPLHGGAVAFAPRPDHIAGAPRQVIAPPKRFPALAARLGAEGAKPAVVYALDFKVDKFQPVTQPARCFPDAVAGVLPALRAKAVLQRGHAQRVKAENHQQAAITRDARRLGEPAVRMGAVFQKVVNQCDIDTFIGERQRPGRADKSGFVLGTLPRWRPLHHMG